MAQHSIKMAQHSIKMTQHSIKMARNMSKMAQKWRQFNKIDHNSIDYNLDHQISLYLLQ